jgi:hypothetical protein
MIPPAQPFPNATVSHEACGALGSRPLTSSTCSRGWRGRGFKEAGPAKVGLGATMTGRTPPPAREQVAFDARDIKILVADVTTKSVSTFAAIS